MIGPAINYNSEDGDGDQGDVSDIKWLAPYSWSQLSHLPENNLAAEICVRDAILTITLRERCIEKKVKKN